MKKIIFIFLLSLIGLSTMAQTWQPVGTGIDNSPANIDHFTDPIMALCEYHGKLYIGGNFASSGGRKTNNFACWNGKKIDTVGRGIDGSVLALLPFDQELCIGGKFVKTAPHRTVGQSIILWRDTSGSWTAMDNAFGSYTIVNSLIIYKNELYSGGKFEGKFNCIAMWNGSSWSKVKNGISSSFPPDGQNESIAAMDESVGAMEEYNGKLYVGGQFHIVDPKYNHDIGCWDGKKWNDVGKMRCRGDVPGTTSIPDDGVITMKTYQHYLYVGGSFDSLAGKRITRFARWNDTVWSGVSNIHGCIFCMLVYNDKLYVGGEFDTIAGKPFKNIACWDGNTWSTVGDGIEFTGRRGFKGRVMALTIYKDELYAGGYFNSSGNVFLNNLAKINLKKKTIIQRK